MCFFPSGVSLPLFPAIFYITVLHSTMIQQKIRIILGGAGFEPKTSDLRSLVHYQ